jgi:large subunit ribosomal protein L3
MQRWDLTEIEAPGGDRITVKNLRVLQVDAGKNLLVVSGAVPGRRGTLVEVRGT